jgi:hypothetical protein
LRGRRLWIALGALLVAVIVLPDVTITDPRVHVRWRGEIVPAHRAALEQRYGLGGGEPVQDTTWRYELRDASPENVRALIGDPAVADTGYIDRPTLAVPEREVRFTMARARFLFGPEPSRLFQPQSLILFAAGAFVLWAAGVPDLRRRRGLAIAALLVTGGAALAVPLRQPIAMGDSDTYTRSRASFEEYSGVDHVRFEAHLSHAILGRLDGWFGRTEGSPSRAMEALMRVGTGWFVLGALAVGFVERWSPTVVRYLGLAVLAPSMLLYFGYRELGHLSLSVAAFPLLVRGLRAGTRHLEAGSTLFGLGAALHGFGVLSLAGAGLAALATRARLSDRIRLALRIGVPGVAAYLAWVALYVIVLKLPVVPGHAAEVPLRPWLADEITDRVNAAILSATGGRDLFFTAWVVGAPLLLIAASLWRQHRDEVRWAMAYLVPSLVFTIMFWPIQGLAVEMDLVFAAFPALYALAWVCAHDARSTMAAAAVLVTSHVAFWRIVLDSAFVTPRV